MQRPATDELAAHFANYVARVPDGPIDRTLEQQAERIGRILAVLDEPRARFRYAPGKWSVKEVIGHLADTERVLAYRALRFARGDRTPLPGFDENAYVAAAGSDGRPLPELAEDWRRVRQATLSLLGSIGEEAALRRGTADQKPASARAMIWAIAGHELHHLAVLRERYGIGV